MNEHQKSSNTNKNQSQKSRNLYTKKYNPFKMTKNKLFWKKSEEDIPNSAERSSKGEWTKWSKETFSECKKRKRKD